MGRILGDCASRVEKGQLVPAIDHNPCVKIELGVLYSLGYFKD
jgi:hypothetical protein